MLAKTCITQENTETHGVSVTYISIIASYAQSWDYKQNLAEPKACVQNE